VRSGFLALAIVTLLAAGGCDDSEFRIKPCETTLAIDGFWNVEWKCVTSGGICMTVTQRVEIVQDMTDLTQLIATIVDSSDPAEIGETLSGDLCGDIFAWMSDAAGADDTGSYIFADVDNFAGLWTFKGGGPTFVCTGPGTREPLAPPPPASCP